MSATSPYNVIGSGLLQPSPKGTVAFEGEPYGSKVSMYLIEYREVGDGPDSGTHYEHDFDALRAASTRIVIAAGAESEGGMANRVAVAVAEGLGTTPVTFPSDHGGFLGGEYGQTGDPDGFASTLREVLTAKA